MSEIVAVTGHRPPKIGGYDSNNPLRSCIRQQIKLWLESFNPDQAITGMALGIDQDFAEICFELKIPFIAAVPCDAQSETWPEESRKKYAELIHLADHVHIVTPGRYRPWKMQRRNEWMVDSATILLAIWDGSDGGTANCVKYAEQVGLPIHRINPRHV